MAGMAGMMGQTGQTGIEGITMITGKDKVTDRTGIVGDDGDRRDDGGGDGYLFSG